MSYRHGKVWLVLTMVVAELGQVTETCITYFVRPPCSLINHEHTSSQRDYLKTVVEYKLALVVVHSSISTTPEPSTNNMYN